MDKNATRAYEAATATQSLSSQLAAQSKRKEKARIAARARRSQEASIIMEMANELHITQEKVRRIDKATIVKLAIDYLKAFEILCRLRSCNNSSAINTNNTPKTSINGIIGSNTSIKISNSCSENCSCLANSCSGSSRISSSSSRNSSSSRSVDSNEILQMNGNSCNNIINIGDKATCGSSEPSPSLCITPTSSLSSVESPVSLRPIIRSQIHKECERRGAEQAPQRQSSSYPVPKLNTRSIFAPKTNDMDQHFLMIKERNGRASFVLKPDTEILDEDDLTHLAPQAGDISISLEVEPLDGIVLDTSLFGGSPPSKKAPIHLMGAGKDLIDTCCIGSVD